MSLLAQILAWSESDLAPWQRDALRRLFEQQGNITDSDLMDLCALLKAEHGVLDPQTRVVNPLAQKHIPAASAVGAKVTLEAMRDLVDVNAIAAGQKLSFSPTGMTVIYGGNGSGKSGYSRVLKRACRARDATEPLLSNVWDPAAKNKVPQATFDIDVGGQKLAVTWKKSDASAPDSLSAIAVFDSHCARSYLDDELDVAFVPYGLDIVESLASKVMPGVIQRLTLEQQSISTDTSAFADLPEATAAGQLVRGLRGYSSVQDIDRLDQAARKLGVLSDDERKRKDVLAKMLSETDPVAKAADLKRTAKRVEDLIARISLKSRWGADSMIGEARKVDAETEAAIVAANAAAESFRSNETLLSGTGDAAWRNLFESAKRFSEEAAYIGHAFPHSGDDAQCVLCQQLLGPGAGDRLSRFDQFLKQDTAKQAEARTKDRAERWAKVKQASLDVGLDQALAQELTAIDAEIVETISKYVQSIELRREWLVEQLDSHDWSAPPDLAPDPTPRLTAIHQNVFTQALELEKSASPDEKRKLLAEHVDLDARLKLSERQQAFLDLVGRVKYVLVLRKAVASIRTKAVSDKAKAFASQQVTEALRTALNEEFVALDVPHVKTKLRERAEKGTTKHKLLLDLPQSGDVSSVLSEGEQRSVAIGSFLAELRVSGHKGGIVFDDPVSSLDHRRRLQVAERLAKEAAQRQVVIFTHDTVFLSQLRQILKRDSVTHTICHLEWNDRPGCVCDGLPWDHAGYKERIKYHEGKAAGMAGGWPAYPNAQQTAEMRHEYSLLRSTVEAVVEVVFLNGVVTRFSGYIQPGQLGGVAYVTQAECDTVKNIYQFCHQVTDAHSTASAAAVPVPNAARYMQDVAELKAAIAAIHARRPKP